jgi:hypothetical protein
MEINSIDFSLTVIYKIVCKDKNITECYVGRTTNFIKREKQHQYSCNTENCKAHKMKVYKFINEHGGWDNWSIEIIEYIDEYDKLQEREHYWFDFLNASLNQTVPGTKTLETKRNYARNYYRDKISTNPEMLRVLCERRKEYIKKNNIKNNIVPKPVGRPRKSYKLN